MLLAEPKRGFPETCAARRELAEGGAAKGKPPLPPLPPAVGAERAAAPAEGSAASEAGTLKRFLLTPDPEGFTALLPLGGRLDRGVLGLLSRHRK